MRGLTQSLWPVRYKPLDDELLSCWLVRLAHGQGLKVQTFCNLVFGNRLQVWNRDVDRLAPSWLLDALVEGTGTPYERVVATTLRAFEGTLYPRFNETGVLRWVLFLQMYHRRRQGFGQQYCPACFAQDAVPYFRKSWRLALITFCVDHQCMLLDQCTQCDCGIAFHRLDIGQYQAPAKSVLLTCFNCGFNLAQAQTIPIVTYNEEAVAWLQRITVATTKLSTQRVTNYPSDKTAVLRHLTSLILTSRKSVNLREYLLNVMGLEHELKLPVQNKLLIEALPVAIRHQVLQMAAWILVDPQERLLQAWRNRAVRYNHYTRGFDESPDWYKEVVSRMINWRMRAW